MFSLFTNLLQGIGKAGSGASQGIGKAGSDILSMTAAGRNLNNLKQQKFANSFRILQEIDDPQAKANYLNQMRTDYADIIAPLQEMGKKAFISGQERRSKKEHKQEMEISKAREGRTQKAWEAVPEDQRQYWSSYGGLRSSANKSGVFDALDKRTKQQKSIDSFQDTVSDEEGKLSKADQELLERARREAGLQSSEQENKTVIEKRMAEYFDRTRPTGEMPPTAGKPQPKRSNIRDYFTEGVNPFQQPPATVEMQPTGRKTYAEIGIATREAQQQFDELQKGLPDIDLRSEYQKDPQTFKRLLDLLKNKKLTTKEVIEILQEAFAR